MAALGFESEEKPRSPSPARAPPAKGKLFADSQKRYQITRVIEPSLLGEILRAYDHLVKKDVVIKRSFRRCVENGRTINGRRTDEDLLEEIRIHSLISSDRNRSPYIIDQLDVFKDDRYINVVLPFAPKDLFKHMETLNIRLDNDLASCPRGSSERAGLLKAHWKECHRVISQLVKGTKYLHSRRIAHRDLSLENTLMDEDNNVQIIDFGMAKDYGRSDPPPKWFANLDSDSREAVRAKIKASVDEFGSISSSVEEKLMKLGLSERNVKELISYTRSPRKEADWLSTKNPIGKTKYCSPECYIYMFYDGRDNDCWSLGVCLFMMLVGAPPYETPSRMDKRFQLIYEKGYRGIEKLLKTWNRLERVPEHALDLLALIFRPQKSRLTINEIEEHPYFTTGGCLPKNKTRPPRWSSIQPIYPPKTPDRELRRLVHDQRYKKRDLKVPECWSRLRREVREQIVQAVVFNNQKSISTVMDKVFVKQLFRKVAVITNPWQDDNATMSLCVDNVREIIHWLWMAGWKPQSTNFFEEEKPDSDDELKAPENAANAVHYDENTLSLPSAAPPPVSPSQRQKCAGPNNCRPTQDLNLGRERSRLRILVDPQQRQERENPDTILELEQEKGADDNKGKESAQEKPRRKSSFLRDALNGVSALFSGNSNRRLAGFPLTP